MNSDAINALKTKVLRRYPSVFEARGRVLYFRSEEPDEIEAPAYILHRYRRWLEWARVRGK